MPRFLVLARDLPESFTALSPEEMQRIIQRYVVWSDGLAAAGRLEAGEKLRDGQGRVLREGSVTDGPFAEVKEVVGGVWILKADDLDHCQALVADSPHLDYGSLEIREIEDLS